MKSLGIELSGDDKRLPYLHWSLKLHKSPVKHRFIASSSKCTTKQLSSLLTKILTVIKTGLEKYPTSAWLIDFCQGYIALRLEKSFKKFYGRYQNLIEKYERSVGVMLNNSFPG